MQVQVPVLETKVCKELYRLKDLLKSDKQFGENVICAGHLTGGKDSCQGDSGGPMMLPIEEIETYPLFQIGIVSYGDGCAKPNAPGINTNVAFYATWINDILNKEI